MSIPVSDAGLQPERTALSWTRTALAMMVCSVTLLRWSDPYPDIVFSAIILLAALSIALILVNRRTYRTEAVELSREYASPNVLGVGLMTLMLTLLGGIGLLLLLIQA
ncbi:DUF202 domain-containing protein [Corynebacterium qintianiae]|uniref:DUF202 domain-containing protein n=1 Tax=Corynebacterium qintianiae TaxID=2709392 RepID=A0A7T0PFW8_9CORY|nr:DUF202 domain-containing protein [Corynebacterium qintianiae]QPK83222.1 DUF202 domain-containing protein [Corynebacterium qintianiae]